ncbi:MAG: HAMP domain-containing sensor histidine kinase [bacterium]
MHHVLERQIKRALGITSLEEVTPQWLALLNSVSETYAHADDDRALLSRSLSLSSKEFAELNRRLQQENEIIEQKVKDRTYELELERGKLDSIAQHMSTGAILLNAAGEVTFVNRAAMEFLELSEPHKAIDALASLFSAVPVRDNITQTLTGTSVTVRSAEAARKVFSITFDSLATEENIFGSLIWLNDITAQELLDRGKNQFISIASHEMRTPLAIIRGNAELILDDPSIEANPSIAEETHSILKSSVRLLGIVNDFLDLQNIESRKIALKPEPVELVQLLSEIVKDFSKLAEDKHITITFDSASAPTLPLVYLDRMRLQQICTNIISNAIHYTLKGGITVSMRKNDSTVTITCQDTGIGIEPEDQEHIFKKFATGKMFLHTKEYGSGLGLYISALLAHAFGGEVRLDKSVVGQGSTFSITLPIIPLPSTEKSIV